MRLALNYYRVDPSRGGAETYVVDLCRSLIRAGHEVELFAHEWDEAVLPPEVVRHHVEASGRTRWGRLWDFAVRSEAALGNSQFDCTIGFINTWGHDLIIPQGGVHRASLECNARRFEAGWRRWLYKAAKRANPKFRMYRAIERRQYDPSRAAHVVAVSDMVRGHLEHYCHVARDRIRVIPNAIDAGRLDVADPIGVRRRFREEHRLAEDDLVALFVGHNFWLKGLKPLLIALELRQSRSPSGRPIHLLVCGGGNLNPFRKLVARLGLADRVLLIGFLPNVADAFWASDFFVSPTYYDPCSLVVFEALACGLPVITTSCNGAGELISSGREGFVVNAPDAHAHLADALERMADDDSRRVMSLHAARLGRAQSFDHHVTRLLAFCREIADSKRAGTPHSRIGPTPATYGVRAHRTKED